MPDEDRRRALVEISEAMAPGWERRRARIDGAVAPVREWLVRALAPAPGDTVLELAAASGDTGLDAAAAVGEGGRLIATDLTPAMVEIGRRRAAEVRARNVEHRVMDAERIDLPDGSVDGVLCRFGYMLMVDPAAALAGTRRVLRPGGRVALAVWGPPERNPWLAIGGAALQERGHVPPPDPGEPSPFAMASAERILAMLAEAGLKGARVEEVPVVWAYRDAEDYIEIMSDTAPVGRVIRGLPAGERDELRRRLEAAFAPFASGDGLAVPGVALCALAEAP
ncbi:MAG TPA: methyltransferase domain-containing protein [Miltoncostaeaceae bacterium]|nr:methyltransferase domain-containing protein [Miltoncostaeaceae bacterium]